MTAPTGWRGIDSVCLRRAANGRPYDVTRRFHYAQSSQRQLPFQLFPVELFFPVFRLLPVLLELFFPVLGQLLVLGGFLPVVGLLVLGGFLPAFLPFRFQPFQRLGVL